MTELTRDAILEKPAGREIDVLIAEVMGWEWETREGDPVLMGPETPDKYGNTWRLTYWPSREHDTAPGPYGMPRYSADIAAALQVVEWLQDDGTWTYRFDLGGVTTSETDRPVRLWFAQFGGGEATAETAALAICRAVLLEMLETGGQGD